jgi:hypothetical protein
MENTIPGAQCRNGYGIRIFWQIDMELISQETLALEIECTDRDKIPHV